MANVFVEVAGYLRKLIDLGASTVNETGVAREYYGEGVVLLDGSGNVATLGTVPKAGTGTITSVASTNASTTLLAANANRLGASIYNDDANTLYVACSSVTASATVYTLQVFPFSQEEIPFNYTGIIKGIWSATGAGAARVTEYTA